LAARIDELSRIVKAGALPNAETIADLRGAIAFPPEGGTRVFYTVPADKWLVIRHYGHGRGAHDFGIIEGGVVTDVLPSASLDSPLARPLGILVPPGSEIGFSANFPGTPSAPFEVRFELNGYLTDA
jgi:hypothetical protein